MNPEFSAGPLRALARNRTLGKLAALIQPGLRNFLEGEGNWRRPLKDVLHGTFLGHPLHPLLTDIPIGAWSVAAACDAMDLAGIERYREAADVAIAIGALGAVGAAASGLADWSDTKDEPQRLGMLHAILNTAALMGYVASFIARRRGARRFGLAAAFTGYGIMGVAGYLGGELTFGMQLGVKHTVIPIDPPRDFVDVIAEPELTGGVMRAVDVEATPVLVTRFEQTVRAVGGVCTHRGAALAEGRQDGRCVRCPWHGSRFSLEDGSILEGPATFPLPAFETQVRAGAVSIRTARGVAAEA